jgi:hypothetical protein
MHVQQMNHFSGFFKTVASHFYLQYSVIFFLTPYPMYHTLKSHSYGTHTIPNSMPALICLLNCIIIIVTIMYFTHT